MDTWQSMMGSYQILSKAIFHSKSRRRTHPQFHTLFFSMVTTNLALQVATLECVRIRRPRSGWKQKSHGGFSCCSRSICMNGCGGGGVEPVEICSTRVLLSVPTLEDAMPQLHSAIAALDANPPSASSGVIRLEVPIRRREDAIGWLREQKKVMVMSRIFFSGREKGKGDLGGDLVGDDGLERKIVSVAGVGSAVYFRGIDPFSFGDWNSIKRFLSKNNPFIRAYGAIRFDARRDISPEWRDFGSFYFIVPQVEFNELEESSTLATNIIWDVSLLRPWRKAIDGLKFTMSQISPFSPKPQNDLPVATIISHNDIPNRISWDAVVEKAMQIIRRRSSEFVKVVLARSSRMIINTDMDPLILLACLSAEGQNAYQFCIQPSDASAFIGNTPEKLFHRKYLHVSSEALAGTRGRGVSRDEDLQIENDLLQSRKDDIEFTIVRESIRQKLEAICDEVIVKPSKTIRKLPRVQHLYAQLTTRLKSADDEFDILSSLHPTPAVCGLPTEEARQFIAETETFDRGMYAGPVGWFGGNESEFAVGIRSALVEKGNGTYIYAGVGIVEGTDPSLEWAELELKTSQFTKLLQQGK